jgi:hypothetical protein
MILLVRTTTEHQVVSKLEQMQAGKSPMVSINEYAFMTHGLPSNRPLLNFLAARFLVYDLAIGKPHRRITRQLNLLTEIDGVRVYENPEALPRAFYVPKLAVERIPVRILATLSQSYHLPREVAWVEEPPADGFLGVPRGEDRGPARGSVEILSDRGEEIVLRSAVEEDGFVVISDQYYPGWEATVNGTPTPILRANYAFKALRVPAGSSDIVLEYRPKSVPLGAGLSLAAMLVAGAIAFVPGSRGD